MRMPTLCTTRPAVVFAAVCLLLLFLELTVVSEEEREGRWMHKKTAQGQVIHGTNPEVPVSTMVACSALCERSVGCALAVWTPGRCRLKRKMKPLSMRADLTSSVWISHRLSRAHDSTRFERLRALWSSPDPDNCGDEPTKPSRYVVWTYTPIRPRLC